jgi:hypothetical protein
MAKRKPTNWEAKARYLAAMIALVPMNMRREPDEDDLSLADDILAQYPAAQTCDECDGACEVAYGQDGAPYEPCRKCKGTGEQPDD